MRGGCDKVYGGRLCGRCMSGSKRGMWQVSEGVRRVRG